MNIIDFYKSLFESLGLTVLDDGVVCVRDANEDKYDPVKVSGTKKILRLPVTEFLKNPDYNKYTPFHPMYENIMNKDAPTLTFIRNLVIAAVNRRYTATIVTIAEFISTVKPTDKVSSTQLEICKMLPNIDDKAFKSIFDITSKINTKLTSMTSSIVYPVIRPTNKNVPSEQNYNKAVDTIFPLYQLIEKCKDETILGIKLRKKDVQTLKDLYNKVLFDKISEGYVYYSGSLAASNLHALLTWYISITMEYNKLNEKMGLDTVPLGFIEGLNDFEALKIQVPLLPDNEGEPKLRVNKQTAGLSSNNLKDISEIPTSAPSAQTQPVQPAAPVVVQPQQQPAPVVTQQPVQYQQQPQQQVQQQVQPQAPVQPQFPDREGIDFVYEQIGNQRCKKYLNTAAYQASLGIQPMVQTPYGLMPPQPMMTQQMIPGYQNMAPPMYPQQYPVQPVYQPPYGQYPPQPMMPNSATYGYQYPPNYPRQMPRIDPRTSMARAANPAAYGVPVYNNPAMMPPQQRGKPYR